MKRFSVLAALLLAALCLTGCRVRTTVTLPGTDEAADALSPVQQGEEQQDSAQEPTAEGESPTREDPNAPRKEYDAQADAQITPDAEEALRKDGADGAGSAADVPPSGGQHEEDAARSATQTVAAEEADKTGTDDDAALADTAFYYYETLLDERLGALFECEKLYVYWETATAYETVLRTSQEHALILRAGAYDVSAKLLAENLRVDDGWVQRKNPDVVVKVVGAGTLSAAAAQSARDALCAREGWSAIRAVESGRVVLLSQDLLATPALRTAAALQLAKLMYPEAFADVDAQEALARLSEEESGQALSGTYFYVG